MRDILASVEAFLTGKRRDLVALVGLVAMVLMPQATSAFNQPACNFNFGFSNFADGGSPPEGYTPGIILSEVVQYFGASTLRDADGDKLPGENRVSALVNTHELFFLPKLNEPLTGAQLGLDIVFPVAAGSVTIDGFSDSGPQGFGDFIFSPLLQWNNHTLFGLPYYHRFEVHTSAPTGQFDKDSTFNPGCNVWTVAPYYAQTLWFLPYNLEVSFRHQWRYVTEDPDTNIQAGQTYIVNYAASYGVTQNFRVGINGYAMQQLTDDEQNGNKIPDSKERLFGLGPGVLYNKGSLTLMAMYYHEFAAQNRFEGFRVSTRMIYKF